MNIKLFYFYRLFIRNLNLIIITRITEIKINFLLLLLLPHLLDYRHVHFLTH